MSAIETIETRCGGEGCGAELRLTLPGDGPAARWARSMFKRQARCDDCIAREEAQAAERETGQARETRRQQSGLPATLRGLLIGELTPKDGQFRAQKAVREWAETEKPGCLVLTGPVGRGKTHLAGAACWTRLERWPCKYASVARSMAKLGASFTDDGRMEAVRVFSGNGAIVLDDLDKCRATEYGIGQLFSAIDGRQQAGAALLVTTNLTPDQIGETFGEPLMSRLAAPFCRVVEVGGDDWRVAQ